MSRLVSLWILFIFSIPLWGQASVFQGRIDFGRDLASFESSPPQAGTLYLLTGAAASVRIVSETPFVAEVEFVQGEWQGEDALVSHRVTLRFSGPEWAQRVVVRKPRQAFEGLVYPYRKFQAAVLAEGTGFRVVALPLLF